IVIDQDGMRRETVKGKHELHDHDIRMPKQAMAETKPSMCDGRWNGLRRPQGEESTQASPFFDQSQGEAGALGSEKVAYEWPVDGQCGSARMFWTHSRPFSANVEHTHGRSMATWDRGPACVSCSGRTGPRHGRLSLMVSATHAVTVFCARWSLP